MPQKIRMDHLLVRRGFFSSRTDAQKAVLSGAVRALSQIVQKSSQVFDPDVDIEILKKSRYVSRGGEKLEAALKSFSVNPEGKVCIDIGSSTGGFTDCLLQHGATKVYAVDVGYGQLALLLRNDPRVIVMEKVNARYLKNTDFQESIDLAVIDVSFISLENILPAAKPLLKANGQILALIKPQFEVGKGKVGKGGVVRDEALRLEAVKKIEEFSKEIGLDSRGVIQSPLKGPAGNVEYFIYLVRN